MCQSQVCRIHNRLRPATSRLALVCWMVIGLQAWGGWCRCTVSCFFINYIAVNCGTPSSLSNGLRLYSGTTFGYTVTYTCNTGYLRTAGSSSRTCQSNGQWSGSHPTCTRKSTLCHSIFFTYRLQTCKVIAIIHLIFTPYHFISYNHCFL